MAITNFVKRIQDVMRNDAGVNGDAQRIEQIAWILFLKIYDAKEEEWELINDDYVSIIPDEYKWRNWAVDNKDGLALTGDALPHNGAVVQNVRLLLQYCGWFLYK